MKRSPHKIHYHNTGIFGRAQVSAEEVTAHVDNLTRLYELTKDPEYVEALKDWYPPGLLLGVDQNGEVVVDKNHLSRKQGFYAKFRKIQRSPACYRIEKINDMIEVVKKQRREPMRGEWLSVLMNLRSDTIRELRGVRE